jgi:hypothetical protein
LEIIMLSTSIKRTVAAAAFVAAAAAALPAYAQNCTGNKYVPSREEAKARCAATPQGASNGRALESCVDKLVTMCVSPRSGTTKTSATPAPQ